MFGGKLLTVFCSHEACLLLPALARLPGSTYTWKSSGQPCVQELQQQLNSNPAFKQFVDQPNKLLSVLQHDPVLAEAAKGSPEIAALLDPGTLQQALSVLQPRTQQHHEQQQQLPVLNIPRKALMQMQNYAMQLNQARAAGHNPVPLQPLPLQMQHAAGGQQEGLGPAGAAAASGMPDNAMWAAMQQRLNKLQQRSILLGAMPAGMGTGEVASHCFCDTCPFSATADAVPFVCQSQAVAAQTSLDGQSAVVSCAQSQQAASTADVVVLSVLGTHKYAQCVCEQYW